MLGLRSDFIPKRTLSAAMSMVLSVLTAWPVHALGMDLNAEEYEIGIQAKANRKIIIRDERGQFLGYAMNDTPFSTKVSGDLVRRLSRDGVPDDRKIVEAASNIVDTAGGRYMPMDVQYQFRTVEGTVITPPKRILLDLRYFWNDDLQVSGATGTDDAVADEFNDSVFENARRNPPTEPMAEPPRTEAEETEPEQEQQTASEEDFSFEDDGQATFARGGAFPAKYLSAPTCSCPAGCGAASNYGPRTRPVTSWKWVRNRRGKKVRVPRTYGSAFHKGVDIGGRGRTGAGIVAAADGIVKVRKLSDGGYGMSVYIDHGNGIRTQYSHLKSIDPSIRIGTRVKRGQIIGRMGSTGNSSGPHLHFGLWKEMRPGQFASINPKASMLIDMNSPAAFNKSCTNMPEYPEVDRLMDAALRGALSRGTGSGRTSRSTSAN
jgi:murein DD-endopeptidase MepM/ murein hydrolase activator NlpD